MGQRAPPRCLAKNAVTSPAVRPCTALPPVVAPRHRAHRIDSRRDVAHGFALSKDSGGPRDRLDAADERRESPLHQLRARQCRRPVVELGREDEERRGRLEFGGPARVADGARGIERDRRHEAATLALGKGGRIPRRRDDRGEGARSAMGAAHHAHATAVDVREGAHVVERVYASATRSETAPRRCGWVRDRCRRRPGSAGREAVRNGRPRIRARPGASPIGAARRWSAASPLQSCSMTIAGKWSPPSGLRTSIGNAMAARPAPGRAAHSASEAARIHASFIAAATP